MTSVCLAYITVWEMYGHVKSMYLQLSMSQPATSKYNNNIRPDYLFHIGYCKTLFGQM